MKQALTLIVSSIVDHPDELSITESENDGVVSFVIYVHPEDMGKLIGKSGKVIRSIRNIMKVPAIKQSKRIDISIAEK